MPGRAICPYCKAVVQPLVGADGQNLCPVCHNQGTAGAAAPAQSIVPGRPTVPGAVASLVLGIVGVMTQPLGLVSIAIGAVTVLFMIFFFGMLGGL